jgi:HlyD family secretion protein
LQNQAFCLRYLSVPLNSHKNRRIFFKISKDSKQIQCEKKVAPPAGEASAESACAVAACLGRIEPQTRLRKVAPPDFLTNPRLEALNVGVGDQVEQGQLLGWFAGRGKAMADMEVAQANVAQAEAAFRLVQAGTKPSMLAAMQEQLKAARLESSWANEESARAQRLLKDSATTQEDVAARRHSAEQAQQAVLRLEQEYRAAAEVRAEDLAVAQAALQVAQAQRSRAEAEVHLQEIRAPITGTVLDIRVWPGEAADASGVLDLADLRAMDVVAEVFETESMAVKLGQMAEVLVPGLPQRLQGKVSLLGHMVKKKSTIEQDPVADIDSRVVEVRVTLDETSAQQVRRMVHQQVQVVIAPPQTSRE